MRIRTWPPGALLCLLALAASGPSRAAEPKPGTEPGLIVRVKSLDGLLDDVRYLAKAMGKDEQAKQFEKMLLSQDQVEKGLKGLDRTRPIGLYGTIGQFGFDSTVVALLPVKDEDSVLALLENLNLKAEKGDDGIYTISTGQVPVYFRFANHYAYVTGLNKDALDKAKLLAPADVLPESEKALISLTARIDRVPEGMKKQALDQFEDKIKEEADKRDPNETDLQHQLKAEVTRETAALIKAVVQEGRALEARVEVDRQKNELVVETSLDALPGSKLATALQHVGQQKTLFAGLAAEHSAFTLLTHLALPEQTLKPLGEVLDEAVKKELVKQEDKEKREQAEKVMKALMPTLKSGECDFGMAIRGPGTDKTYTVVAGLKVKDGEALEKAVKDVVQGLPADQRKEVHLDAAKAGDIALHRIDITKLDEDAKAAFGEHPEAYVAFRPDAVLFTMGGDALGAMKQAVAVEGGPGQPFLMDIRLAQLAPAMEKKNPGAVKAAEEIFKEKGQDQVYAAARGGKALQVVLRLKPEALNFFSQLSPKANLKP
jgi:hypothetical protein